MARWGDDVGVALLTWVTSTSSHRCDLAALAQHGRQMGTLVGVDITQGVGIVPFTVIEGIDFVVSSSLKWLCGPSGAGILYVDQEILPGCRPEFRGWFSQENPFSWDLDSFQYAADARRFDHGTPAILASVASLPGLRFVEQTGINALRAHNLKLTEQIIDHAQAAGWTIASPLNAEQRGGSIMIRLSDDTDLKAMIEQLRARELYCDARGQTLRLSPGISTTEEDTYELCRSISELA